MSFEGVPHASLENASERREPEPVELIVEINTIDLDDIDVSALTDELRQHLDEEPDFIRRFSIATATGPQWHYLVGATEFIGSELSTPLDTHAPIRAISESSGRKWELTAWDHLAHRPDFKFTGTIDTELQVQPDGSYSPLSFLEPYRVEPQVFK